MQKRVNLYNIKKSGLSGVIDRMTFATFQAKEDWQVKLFTQAQKYCEKLLEGGTEWLMICGQVGSGKTHLATAIMRDALFSGFDAKYVLWREAAMRLKRSALDEDYTEKLDELIKPNVLYIDDFFKGNITDADKNVAYDIINGRYMQNRPTIITCEKTLKQIMEIDEAVGSRILQMTDGNYFEIAQDVKKNKRISI
jgi:DNA replication protein DnaC